MANLFLFLKPISLKETEETVQIEAFPKESQSVLSSPLLSGTAKAQGSSASQHSAARTLDVLDSGTVSQQQLKNAQ